MKKTFLLLVLTLLYSACTVTKTPEKTSYRFNANNLIPYQNSSDIEYLDIDVKASKVDKIFKYQHQFIPFTIESDHYATIRSYPYSGYFSDFRPVRRPFLPYSLNGQIIKRAKNPFLVNESFVSLLQYGMMELKIPAGQHDLVVVHGDQRSYYTEFKNLRFEAGKKYIIGADFSSRSKEKNKLFIAKYEMNSNFKTNHIENIYLKQRIAEGVPEGNLKIVKEY